MQTKAEHVSKPPHVGAHVECAEKRSVDHACLDRGVMPSPLSSGGRSAESILMLQRAVGNRRVGELLGRQGSVMNAVSAQVPQQLLQRAPAPAAGNAKTTEKPVAAPGKPGLQLSNDEWIWVLETFRRDSPGDFVKLLEKHENEFYPILKPYGFQGSWVDEKRYLSDFDAAVAKWGKSHTYFNRTMTAIRAAPAAPAAKAETLEDWRYHQAQLLLPVLSGHGYSRGEVNDQLDSSGLMEELERHGFEKAGTYSFTDSVAYQDRAVQALNQYIDRYRASHGLGTGPTVNGPSQGVYDIEFIRAWLEGLSYISNSPMAALAAGTAMKFTDDPRKIAAAAGMGAAFEGAVGSVAAGLGGSYSPEVVGPRDRPTAVRQERYSGRAPMEPVRDPKYVGAPKAPERVPTPTPPPRIVRLDNNVFAELGRGNVPVANALRRLSQDPNVVLEMTQGVYIETTRVTGDMLTVRKALIATLNIKIVDEKMADRLRTYDDYANSPDFPTHGGPKATNTEKETLEDLPHLASAKAAGPRAELWSFDARVQSSAGRLGVRIAPESAIPIHKNVPDSAANVEKLFPEVKLPAGSPTGPVPKK